MERHFFILSECLSNVLITEESNFDERNAQRLILKEITFKKIHTLAVHVATLTAHHKCCTTVVSPNHSFDGLLSDPLAYFGININIKRPFMTKNQGP